MLCINPSKCTHTHTHTHTHTRSRGQPFMLRHRGAVGGPVPCSRVSPQSWYWGWRECCIFTPPPTYNSCRPETRTHNLSIMSPTLTIRPRLPLSKKTPQLSSLLWMRPTAVMWLGLNTQMCLKVIKWMNWSRCSSFGSLARLWKCLHVNREVRGGWRDEGGNEQTNHGGHIETGHIMFKRINRKIFHLQTVK